MSKSSEIMASKERIEALERTILATLSHGLGFAGHDFSRPYPDRKLKQVVALQRALHSQILASDKLEQRKATENVMEHIFSHLAALLGPDISLLDVADDQDADGNRAKQVAARRLIGAIRKAVDRHTFMNQSPIADLDDGLRALLAGEKSPIFRPAPRTGKFRRAHSVRRIQYMACALRQALIDEGVPAGEASKIFEDDFWQHWDTARKWPESMWEFLSPYDVKLWERQLASGREEGEEPVAAIRAQLRLLREAYDEVLRDDAAST